MSTIIFLVFVLCVCVRERQRELTNICILLLNCYVCYLNRFSEWVDFKWERARTLALKAWLQLRRKEKSVWDEWKNDEQRQRREFLFTSIFILYIWMREAQLHGFRLFASKSHPISIRFFSLTILPLFDQKRSFLCSQNVLGILKSAGGLNCSADSDLGAIEGLWQ